MGAVAGAVSDAAVGAAQVGASYYTADKNYQAQIETNKSNERNVAATNKTNMDIAQMSNEYNEKMLERQIEQEWNMWTAENEYNTPAAQAQRFKDAGINPYMAVGNVSSGNASSMSSPAAQPAVTPQIQAFQAQAPRMETPDFSGLRGVARGMVELMNAHEDTKAKQLANEGAAIDNEYKSRMYEMELWSKLQSGKLTREQRRGLQTENFFKPEMISSELRRRSSDTMYRNLMSQGQMIANLSALQWYKVLPAQIQQSILSSAMDIRQRYYQGSLTKQQVKTEVHRTVEQKYKGLTEKFNYKQKERLVDELDAIIVNSSTPNLTNNPIGFGKSLGREFSNNRYVRSVLDYDGFVWWNPNTW